MPEAERSRLIADRIVGDGCGRAIDLVTGAHVRLRVLPADSAAAQRVWAERCARWYTYRAPHRPILRDYGVIGAHSRFEVVEMPAAARNRHRAAQSDCCTEADLDWDSRATHLIQPRRAVVRITAWLDERHAAPVRELHVHGPGRSGLSTTAELVAREARLRGFVPVNPAVLAALPPDLQAEVLQILSSRHLVVLRDRTGGDKHDSLLLDRLARCAERPIALVAFVRTPSPSTAHLPLDPLDDPALLRMIRAWRLGAADRRRARRCAERADGWPGRFLDGWQRMEVVRYRVRRTGILTAAERAPAYGDPGSEPGDADEAAHGELARSTIERATRLTSVGRHAAARGALADCAAHLERTGSTLALARVRLALGSLLRARGLLRDAIREIDLALAAAPIEGADLLQTEIIACLCRALCDQAELRRAESVARVAHAARRVEGSATSTDRAITHALASALYWQARYDEADRVVLEGGHEDGSALALRARVALVRGELAEAALLAQRALAATASLADEARLEALASAVVVAGATADADKVQTLSVEGLLVAHRIRQPIWAIEIRLARVEALLRAHDPGGARAAARGLRRVAAQRNLRLLGARARTLLGAFEPAHPESADRETCPALADLQAALHAGTARSARRRIRDDLAALIELAQEAPDERTALHTMTAFMARSLPHSTVGIFAKAERTISLLVSSDPSMGAQVPDLACRAIDAGILVGPSRGSEGVEVAVPIRFAGSIVGALFCRWCVDGPLDWTRIEVLLSAGASAAGACVSAAVDRRVDSSAVIAGDLIGRSTAMHALRDHIRRAGSAPFPVLIEGESGAGKELVARAIHRASPRRDRKWCALNCAALNDDLLEAELFGHARGAFTGAIAERPGLFEDADGGTLFLDEVGELSPRAQAKLLRVLQEGEVRRLGHNATRRVDVRIVAATNRHLAEDVAGGRFRQDLWYRLAIIRIAVPPLRVRPDDVPELVKEFWRRAAERTGSKAVLTAPTVAALARYDWPGNVRELQNVLAALSVSAPPRGPVTPAQLPDAILRTADAPASLDQARRMFERRFVRAAMARAGGRIAVAARELGITRQGLTKLLARLERGDPAATNSCGQEPQS